MPARAHRPDEYRDVFEGYRAIRMSDGAGRLRGELVWRLATGQTVEITEADDEATYVSLGYGGELVLEFTDNVLVGGEGMDLAINTSPILSAEDD